MDTHLGGPEPVLQEALEDAGAEQLGPLGGLALVVEIVGAPPVGDRRIIDAVAERLDAKPEQVFINLNKYGNTSAASVAIALDEAVQTGRIQRGDLILLVVFGAGLTWGAAVIEW